MLYDPFYWSQSASISLRTSVSTSMRLACNFLFFVWYLCLVLVSGWWWPQTVSLGVFLPLQFFGRIGVSSSLNVWWNLPLKPSGAELLLVGRFLVTVSISLLVLYLFIFSISSWFSLRSLYFSKNLSISSRVSIFFGLLPLWLSGKESTCTAGDLGLIIPGLERSPGEGKGYPIQYSGLENSMDCIVQVVA